MNCVKIKMDEEDWQVEYHDKQTIVKGETIEERLTHLKELLYGQSFDGGLFIGDHKNESHQQLVMETLNLPFATDESVELSQGVSEAQDKCEWVLSYYDYPKGKEEYSIESLLTVGNGYLGLRGTTPEMEISDAQYPATYLAGLYNEVSSDIQGNEIVNEDFVNAPNGQKMYLIIQGERITIENNQVRVFKRELDLRTGEFESYVMIALENGQTLEIKTTKIASMKDRHYYGIRYSFKLDGDVPDVKFVSELDGSVYNYNVERYRKLNQHHLYVKGVNGTNEYGELCAETTQSKMEILIQSKLMSEDVPVSACHSDLSDTVLTQTISFDMTDSQWYTVDKIVYIEKNPLIQIDSLIRKFPTYDVLKDDSVSEWKRLWQVSGIKVTGDMMSQKMLNLHTYHMLVSGSPNGNKELDASITARGLHGEAYRGHIFWDELFVLPFYMIHFPETARQLLMYRYERLEMAKSMAKEEGVSGAMYPWQSGLDGSEQSQKLHLNPLSGEWKEDHSRLQRHVSLAIAYNIWLYWHHTKDDTFLTDYGKEMLSEIARFWLDMSVKDTKTNRYHISGVMGPDEFHEAYPNATSGGLRDNAYTNLMVAWLFETLLTLHDVYDIDMTYDELSKMQEVMHHLSLDIKDGIVAQFDGYFELEELDWSYYRKKYGNVYRMDRILNAEGKSADSYQVAKQADSLMIYYNFPKETVTELIKGLGYDLPINYVEKNLDYYLARTSHGSTLSRVVHAQLAEMIDDRELAWKLYQEALYSDYQDIQGGTTAEGIHTGVMASTLYVTLTAFAGLDIRGDKLSLQPHLPSKWSELSFNLSKQGIEFIITIGQDDVRINVSADTIIELNGKHIQVYRDNDTIIEYKEISHD